MRKISGINIGIYTVAIGVFVAKLAINSYYKVHGASTASESGRKAEIASFYASPAYRERFKSDSLEVEFVRVQFNQKVERNRFSLEANGTLRHTESLAALKDSIGAISRRRSDWESRVIAGINTRYSTEASGFTFKWGGLGLIYVFEIMSILFGFLAAKRKGTFVVPFLNISVNPQFWICTAASFYAEYASCKITEAALILLVANPDLAATYSTAFMILSPVLFAIGGLQLEDAGAVVNESVVERKPTVVDDVKKTKPAPEVVAQKTFTNRVIRKYEPHPNDPRTYEEAVDRYARDLIGPARGGWDQRRIAEVFFGERNKASTVNKDIATRRKAIQAELEQRKNGHTVEVTE